MSKFERLVEFSENPDPEKLNGTTKSVISSLKAGIGTGLLVMPYIF